MLKLTCTFLYETNAGQLLSGHLHSHSIVHCVCCPCWLSVCLHCWSCSFPSQTFMLAIYYDWHAVATDTVTVTAAPYVQRIDPAITRLGTATAPYLSVQFTPDNRLPSATVTVAAAATFVTHRRRGACTDTDASTPTMWCYGRFI